MLKLAKVKGDLLETPPTRLQPHILLNTYNHSFLYKRKKDHLEKDLSLSLNPNLYKRKKDHLEKDLSLSLNPNLFTCPTLFHSLNLVLSCCLTNLAIRASTINPKVGHGRYKFLFGISGSQVPGHNLV